MKKGPTYSVEQAATVFRKIGELIDQNHELMNTEGVFRLSGEAKELPNIIKKILKNKDMSKDKISIHNLVGALKLVIKELMLLNADDPNLALLREGMQAASSDPQKGIDAFNQVVAHLATSKEAKSQAVAEILHTYVHLAQIASAYQDNNKMTPRNLAIASIGPVFFNNFPLIKNPIEMLTLSDVANNVGEQLIQNPIYSVSFSQRTAASAQNQAGAKETYSSDSDSPPPKRVQVEQGKAHLRRTMTFSVAAMKDAFKSEDKQKQKKERKHKKSAAQDTAQVTPDKPPKEKGRTKNR